MKIVILDEFKVIGFKRTFIEDQLRIEMPRLWNVFMSRLREIENRSDTYVMDISLEVVEKNYTQCICSRVENFDYVPSGMDAIVIPSQKYIHFIHEGNVNDIWLSFLKMQNWAKENGYIIDPLDFKIDSNLENNGLVHDLYIKIL